MPYTVNSSNLPDYVKSLDVDAKAQWVEVFNSALKSCQDSGGEDCEASAFAQANGVVGIGEAEWDTAYVNNLPDSAFAIVLPGGEKDDENKTVPRTLRKLPYKNAQGNVDLPHLRNALARLDQIDASDAQKAEARAELNRAADEHLKTRQEEGMRISDALTKLGEMSNEIVMAVGDLRSAIEALGVEDEGVMGALKKLEMMIMPEPEMDEPEPEMETDPEPESAVSESFAERAASPVSIVEADAQAGPRDPLRVRMRLIQAGPGNSVDNHYYPGEVLRRDAHVFEGVKMYTVDHKEAERSERTEVAVIDRIADFEEDGSPIGEIVIFDPDFAEKTRNRSKARKLDSLECSILATGMARESDEYGGKYNVVDSIDEAQAVDFVTRAGAGGQALSLVESDKNHLEPEKVKSLLDETNLPEKSKERLAASQYDSESTLHEAILREVDYVKELSGSGQPLGAGRTEPVQETEEQRRQRDAEWYEQLREAHGMTPR